MSPEEVAISKSSQDKAQDDKVRDSVTLTRADVEVLAQDTVFQGFFAVDKVTLRHRLFAGGWSGEFSRELFRRGRSVGVLLHDPVRSQLVLVEQFRVGLLRDERHSPWVLELVAGMVDAGEQPHDVALREAHEETGLVIDQVSYICEYYNSPGGSDECISLFYGQVDASGAHGIHGLATENEDIRVKVMGLADAWRRLDEGGFNNAMIIIALQWLRLRLADQAPASVQGNAPSNAPSKKGPAKP